MNIILYLLNYIQYQHKQICWLLNFICRYIPLKQWAFDDSHSPKYQKFKIDKLPVIKPFIKQDSYKPSYRPTNGFDNYDGANYDLALWVAYYNFLRPHKHNKYQPLNKVDMISNADNMPGKWQLLIFLGQQTIINLQAEESKTMYRPFEFSTLCTVPWPNNEYKAP